MVKKPNCRLCKYREKHKCLLFGDEVNYKIKPIVCEAYERKQRNEEEK